MADEPAETIRTYAIYHREPDGEWVVDGVIRSPNVEERVRIRLQRLQQEHPEKEWKAEPYDGPPRKPFEMPPPPAMIPKAECEDRRLYRILSRNLRFGVFREATGGFLGLREKFDDIFVFEEYHWENPSFATVKPIEALSETLPAEIEATESLGSVCHVCGKPSEYAPWPDGGTREITYGDGFKTTARGQHEHVDRSPRCEQMHGDNVYNQALHQWLEAMEEKYDPKPVPDYSKLDDALRAALALPDTRDYDPFTVSVRTSAPPDPEQRKTLSGLGTYDIEPERTVFRAIIRRANIAAFTALPYVQLVTMGFSP